MTASRLPLPSPTLLSMISTCLPPSSTVVDVDLRSAARTDPVASISPVTDKVAPTETEPETGLMVDSVTLPILAAGDVISVALTVAADKVPDTVTVVALTVSEMRIFDAILTPPMLALFVVRVVGVKSTAVNVPTSNVVIFAAEAVSPDALTWKDGPTIPVVALRFVDDTFTADTEA